MYNQFCSAGKKKTGCSIVLHFQPKKYSLEIAFSMSEVSGYYIIYFNDVYSTKGRIASMGDFILRKIAISFTLETVAKERSEKEEKREQKIKNPKR